MNPAMGTVVGELIQMNSKMVMTSTALAMVICGVLAVGYFLRQRLHGGFVTINGGGRG